MDFDPVRTENKAADDKAAETTTATTKRPIFWKSYNDSISVIPNGVDCQSADQRPQKPLSLRERLQGKL